MIELTVQQEVQVAPCLGLAVLRFAQLLFDRQQFGTRTQDLVLRDLAVAEQRVVDAQVLDQQAAARRDDADRAGGLQPVEITDADVALQPARECKARELAGLEPRTLGAHRRRDRGCEQRLTQRQARVLFPFAHQRERGVAECGDGQGDFPAAFGAGVARVDRDFRDVTRARRIECGLGAFDVQRARLQAAVGAQADADVIVDDGGQRARDRRGFGRARWHGPCRERRGAGEGREQTHQPWRHARHHANGRQIRTYRRAGRCWRVFSD